MRRFKGVHRLLPVVVVVVHAVVADVVAAVAVAVADFWHPST
jgi:hypothetical protein